MGLMIPGLVLTLFLTVLEPGQTVRILIDTVAGEIEVEIDAARAPQTSDNFLRYVDEGFYDGGHFHRTVTMQNQPLNGIKIEVIQASANPAREKDGHSPIPLERTSKSGLLHKNGTISMARLGPDTATSSFFFCIGDQPELDFGGARNPDGQGFAAFGHVTRGMDVVRKIQNAAHQEQRLTPPVGIRSIRRMGDGGGR